MNANERDAASRGVGVGRRDFLRAGGMGLGALGLGLAEAGSIGPSARRDDERALILLMMVGGPSQLETWDPKPDAPEEVRGPFRSIATRVPAVRINEHLPLTAARMDRVALVRSVHHDEAPIHETGLQLLQTGRLSRAEDEHPHIGAVVSRLKGPNGPAAPFVMLPGPIQNTGVVLPRGQSAGWLGSAHAPVLVDAADVSDEPERVRRAYGRSRFGKDCLTARRLVESGARVAVVNMFQTVFDEATWDCHGSGPFSTLDDYAKRLLPTFDRAFSALIDDLAARGRLETTLVAAVGEFGRTPRINDSGGRDHWPGAWSIALAGGGVRGGRVIGATDAHAAHPVDRPATPREVLATMYHALDVDPSRLPSRTEAVDPAPTSDAAPILELFS